MFAIHKSFPLRTKCITTTTTTATENMLEANNDQQQFQTKITH